MREPLKPARFTDSQPRGTLPPKGNQRRRQPPIPFGIRGLVRADLTLPRSPGYARSRPLPATAGMVAIDVAKQQRESAIGQGRQDRKGNGREATVGPQRRIEKVSAQQKTARVIAYIRERSYGRHPQILDSEHGYCLLGRRPRVAQTFAWRSDCLKMVGVLELECYPPGSSRL